MLSKPTTWMPAVADAGVRGRAKRVLSRVGLLLATLLAIPAHAYSYAGAGEDALVSGRQALLSAVDQGDEAEIEAALDTLRESVRYLETQVGPGLWSDLSDAARDRRLPHTVDLLNRIFALGIERRLNEARFYITQHQKAKNRVVRCQQMFVFLQPALSAEQVRQGEAALGEALAALGNPGVFGVGVEPADADRLGRAIERYREAVRPWL